MPALPALAFRNLGRNRRRTLLTAAALALGTTLSIVSTGFTDGWVVDMLASLTRYDVGHLQVHQRDWPKSRLLAATIAHADRVIDKASALPGVVGAAPRLYAAALLSHQGKSFGVEMVGVEPAQEGRVTRLAHTVTAGRWLDEQPTPWPAARAPTEEEQARDRAVTQEAAEDAMAEIAALGGLDRAGAEHAAPHARAPSAPDAASAEEFSRKLAAAVAPKPERPPRVALGEALARVLGAGPGDTVHALTQAVDGAPEAVALEVAGVFRTGTAAFDRNRVVLNREDLRRMTHLAAGAAHEVTLLLSDPAAAAGTAGALAAALHDRALLVRPWDVVRPDVAQLMRVSRVSTAVMVFIILFVATLGVVNTMLMAVFERTREIGMLKAIGMSGARVVGLIVAETLAIAMLAGGVGVALGLLLDLYLVRYGLDLGGFTKGFSVAGVGTSPVFHAEITWQGVAVPALMLAGTCLVASLYPAVRAARLRPAVGMRET